MGDPAAAPRRRVVPVMGTVFTLDVRDPVPPDSVLDQVIQWWHWVDDTFSPFRRGSQVSRLSRGTLSLTQCAPEVRHVLRLCQQAHAATDGYFDVYASGRLDPSGLVKGWSVQAASAIIADAGSPNHSINAGGDILCAGQPEPGLNWRVGIADPRRPGALAAIIAVGRGAVATSGTAERGHHVLNPHSGRPATGLASVTVTGPDLTYADAYATAALAMGSRARDWLPRLPHHESLIIGADGARFQTSAFPSA